MWVIISLLRVRKPAGFHVCSVRNTNLSFGGRQLCPDSGQPVPWKKTLAQAVIMVEAPGWSPARHGGADNEVTVLPLPRKAAIAVSFQKRLWS